MAVKIDIKRMKQVLSEDSSTVPKGLSREEMREFMLGHTGPLTHCMAESDTGYCHDNRCPKIAEYDDGGCPYA